MKKYSKVRKRPEKKQWAVYSSKGKKLSRWYSSRKKAVERLRQIEYFKNNADDGLLGISDIVDHNTYTDTLHVKSNDGILNKAAFGLTPAFKDTSPVFYDEEDLSTRFFSGSSDPDNESHNSSPNINNKIKNKKEDKDLEELMDFLIDEGEVKEAYNLKEKLRKISFDLEEWTPDLHKYIPDIDKETLLQDPYAEIPLLGRVGNPLSLNQDALLAGVGFVDRGMKNAEKHFKSFSSNSEAMNVLYQESKAYVDTNEEKTFAAFLYLMKNGKSCKSMVKLSDDGESVYTRYTISDLIKESFASFWSDFLIPGLIVMGKVPLVFSLFPKTFLGRVGGAGAAALSTAFGPGGHILQNISLYKLSQMICNQEIDIKKLNFKEGNLTYEES